MESCKKCKREFTPLRKKFICPDCSDEVCSECCSPPHFIANRRVCASCFNVHSQLYGEQRKIKGHDAYKKKNWKSAYALYDGVQDKNMDPIVCVRLGIMLRRGEGIAQDIEKANILIQTALPLLRARPENIHCIYYLGVLHENGFGMPKNPREAFNYYKMASDQGDSNSQYNIGFMYQYGSEDIPLDYVNAFKYYKLSANREHPDAQFKLGYMYRYGYGVEKDEDKAFKYYMLAGQQGDASAICNIGYMYQSGLGVDVDNVKALLYYKKAAEKRCISAYSSIGYMFEMGLGTTKNYDEAFKNYKIGSDLGCRSAHAFLGQLYELGLGVGEDISQAKHYYSLAAAMGDTFASEKLNYLSSLDGNENRDNTESAYEKK